MVGAVVAKVTGRRERRIRRPYPARADRMKVKLAADGSVGGEFRRTWFTPEGADHFLRTASFSFSGMTRYVSGSIELVARPCVIERSDVV